jgi:hypothetical protein
MGGDAPFARLRVGALRDDLWPDRARLPRGGTPKWFVTFIPIACGTDRAARLVSGLLYSLTKFQ